MRSLLTALVRATNLVTHQIDDRLTELGIGTTELLVMRAPHCNPDASTALIRRSLDMRDAAFSDVVKRLVYRGYLLEDTA